MNSSIIAQVNQSSPLKTDDLIKQQKLPEDNLQNKLLRFLETSAAFKDLIQVEKKQQLLKECISVLDVLSFNENQIIFEQDEPVDGWYVVLKGKVASMSATKLYYSQEHIMVSSRLISGKDAKKQAEEYLDRCFSNNQVDQINQQAFKKDESKQDTQNYDKDEESNKIQNEEEVDFDQNNGIYQEIDNDLDNFVDLRQSMNVDEPGKQNTSNKKRLSRSRSSFSSSSSSSSSSDCLSNDSASNKIIQKSTKLQTNNNNTPTLIFNTKSHSQNSNRFQNSPKSTSNLLSLHILQLFTSGQEFGNEGVLTQLPRASQMISLEPNTIVLKLPHAKYLQCLKTLKDTQLVQNLKIINSCSGLSFLSMHAQKELIIRSHKVILNKGNILCSPACSPPEAVYLIISGQYSLSTFHRWMPQANTFPFYKDFKHIGNSSIQVSVISSGEIYGDEEMILKEQSYKYELKCEEDEGEILIIPRDVYESKICNYDHFYDIVLCKNKILQEHREKQIQNHLNILVKQNKSKQEQQQQIPQSVDQIHRTTSNATGKRTSKKKMLAMEKKKLAEEKRLVEEKQKQNEKEDRLKRAEIQENKKKLIEFRVREQGREMENEQIKDNNGIIISERKDNSIINKGIQRNNRREILLSQMAVKEIGVVSEEGDEQNCLMRIKVNTIEQKKMDFSFKKQEQLSSQQQQSFGQQQSYDVQVLQSMNQELESQNQSSQVSQQKITPKNIFQNSPDVQLNKQKLQIPSRNTPRQKSNTTKNTSQNNQNNNIDNKNNHNDSLCLVVIPDPSSGQNNTKLSSKTCSTRAQLTPLTPVTPNTRRGTTHSQLTIYPSISTTTQISRTINTPQKQVASSETRSTTGVNSTLNGTFSKRGYIPNQNQRPITCTGKDYKNRQNRAISTAPSYDMEQQFGEMQIFQKKRESNCHQYNPNFCVKTENNIENTCISQGKYNNERQINEQYRILQHKSRFNTNLFTENSLNDQYGSEYYQTNINQSEQSKVITRYSVTDSDQFSDDKLCQELFPSFSGKENSRKGWEPVDIYDSNFKYLGVNESMSRVWYENMVKELSVKISRSNSSSFSGQRTQTQRLTGKQQRKLLNKVINIKDLRQHFSLKIDEQIKKRIVGFDSKVNYIRNNQRLNHQSNHKSQGEYHSPNNNDNTTPIQAGITQVLTRLNFQTDHFTNAVQNFKEKNNQKENINTDQQQHEQQINQNATITSTITDKTTKALQQQKLLLLDGQSSSQIFHKTLSSNSSSIERNQFVLDSNFISLESKNHQLRTNQRQKQTQQRNKDTKELLSADKHEQNYYLKPPFVAFGDSQRQSFDQNINKTNSSFIEGTNSSSLTQTFLEKSGVRRTPSAEKRATARAKQKKEFALRKNNRSQDQVGQLSQQQQQYSGGQLSSQELQSIRLMPCPRVGGQEQHHHGNISMYEQFDKEGISNYLKTDNSMSQYQSLTLPTEGSIVNNACGLAAGVTGKMNEIINNNNSHRLLFTDASGNIDNKDVEMKEELKGQQSKNGSARHQHQVEMEQNQLLREKQSIHQKHIKQRGRDNKVMQK